MKRYIIYIQKRKYGFLQWTIAVTMFLSVGPYFAWETFAGGIISALYKAMTAVNLLLILVSIYTKKISYNKIFFSFAMVFIFFFLTFCTGVKGGTYLPLAAGNIINFLTFAFLILCRTKLLGESFDLFKTIYTIVIGYTFIIFIFVIVGISIPYFVIQSAEPGRIAYSGQYYLNFLGCIFIHTKFVRLDRFTGVFTEPGVVGTLSAFLLVTSGCDLKNDKRNIVILISGIFSFSLAFIFLMTIYFIIKSLMKGVHKVTISLIILSLSYLVFTNLSFNNIYLAVLQQRLAISDSGLVGDNRITIYAEEQYKLFLKSDTKTILFGYGKAPENPNTNLNFWQGTATYKRQVFQFGVLGFGIYLLWMIFASLKCYKTRDPRLDHKLYAYMVVFVASMYQRPQITELFFLYLFLAGCAYTVNYNIDKDFKHYYFKK